MLASRGTDTASHCVVVRLACRRSVRIAAAPLDAAFRAAAAGSQSPTAMTARGVAVVAAATASTTAHVPKSSAAGMEST
eukprot:2970537-Pleurochrysis_carterae.AAC.1